MAGHAEMEDEAVTAIRVDHAVFGAPVKPGDASPGQPSTEIDGERMPEVRPSRLDTCNATPVQHARKTSDRGFDFGELRHEPRYGEA
jgi:hypothetical protein